jgi:serine protease
MGAALVWLFCFPVFGQALSWQLGSLARPSDAAPAAINTAGFPVGPNEIVVALIDGGVLPGHPSLQGRLLSGYDMLGNDASKCDQGQGAVKYRTHGTEVASLIVGNGHDGVWGVNPSAKILPVRLFGSCEISRADLLLALAWSAGLPTPSMPVNPTPAQVINLSFAGGRALCGDDLQLLLDRMAAKHIFVVAAVGNSSGKRLLEPANCRGVISVGALDAENQVQEYSALDARTTIYAPGGVVPQPDERLGERSRLRVATFERNWLGFERPSARDKGVGTSYAAPLVSGFVSLLLSHNPELTPAEFMAQLPRFSRALAAPEKCPECLPLGLTMTPKN